MDSYTWTHQFWLSQKNVRSFALCGHSVPSRGLVKSDDTVCVERERERESRESMLSANFDDNDDFLVHYLNQRDQDMTVKIN